MVEVKPVAKTVKAESKKTRAEIEETQDLLKNAKKDIIAEIKEVKTAVPKKLVKRKAKARIAGTAKSKTVKAKALARKTAKPKARAKPKTVSFGAFGIVKNRSLTVQENLKKANAGLKKQISEIDSKLKKRVSGIDKSLRNQVTNLNASINKLKNDKTVSKLAKNFNSFRKTTNAKFNSISGQVKGVKDASLEVYNLKEVAEELKENLDSLNNKVLEGFERIGKEKPAVQQAAQPAFQAIPIQAFPARTRELEDLGFEVKELKKLISDLKSKESKEVFERELQTSLTPSILKPFVPDEQVAVKLVSLYFEEIARMGFKRSLELDSVVNAYMYALERLRRKKIEARAFAPLVVREEEKLKEETKKEMLGESKTTTE